MFITHAWKSNDSKSRLITAFAAFALLSVAAVDVNAQEKDFGAWYSLSIERPVLHWLDLSVNPELRYIDNHSRLKTWILETDATATVNRYVKLGALYRYAVDYSNYDYNERLSRWGVFGKASYRIKPFDIAYRCLFQEQFANYNTSVNGKIPELVWRHKVEVAYSRKKYDFSPFVSAEWFNAVAPAWDKNKQKLRLTLGVDYKLTKRLDASIGYLRQTEWNVKNPLTSHIIVTKLKYEWK